MDVPFFLAIFLLSHLLLLHSFSAKEDNKNQSTCPKSFDCKPLHHPLDFPFSNSTYPQCGLRTVTCDEPLSKIQLGKEGSWYDVTTEENLSGNIFQIHDQFLQTQLETESCDVFKNLSFPNTSSVSFTIYHPYLSFKCNKNFDLKDYHFKEFHNYTNCTDYNLYYKYPYHQLSSPATLPPSCSVIQLPLNLSNTKNHNEDDPFNLLTHTFSLELHLSEDCLRCYLEEGGQCQNDNQKFHCATTNKGIDTPAN
ncbi:hypothetical protein TEA_006982 [Camellia sinensis var. sinensis]|uniref:Wall-associated receptor kinase galacturonan-binding domain-containing protein n=1 Tax=Camellia sinensis var. sinensis TaxID=542762 RepID=A0A4S4EA07_CAMSN|nr:hypothetical protein TEA_006982 [Camellia sinensis var. sinensis]